MVLFISLINLYFSMRIAKYKLIHLKIKYKETPINILIFFFNKALNN
jgi:hypothetical protein